MSIQIDLSEAALSRNWPVLDLPLDHRRIPGESGQNSRELPFTLTSDLIQRLASLSERECISPSSVYLCAYAILLSRYGNTPEVNIYSSSMRQQSSRQADFADNVVNAGVIRACCLPELSLRELLSSLAGGEHDTRKETAQANDAALCHGGFIWECTQPFNSIESRRRTAPPAYEAFDVSLWIQSREGIIVPALLYRSDLFEPETIERMSRHLMRLLAVIADAPEISIAELDMMPADERAMVLQSYAGGSADYPQACLHQLFAEQAALHPDAQAVVFGSGS